MMRMMMRRRIRMMRRIRMEHNHPYPPDGT